jgi:uncharacterized protein (TIGR03067 family)
MENSLAVVTTIVLLLASTATAAELEFESYKSDHGRFSAQFPGEPIAQNQPAGDDITEYQFIRPLADKTVFVVKFFDIPENLVGGREPKELLSLYQSGSRRGVEFREEKELTLNTGIGREYQCEAQPGYFVRERLVLDGRRLYTLYVGATERNLPTSADAQRFFDSFEIKLPPKLSGRWKVEVYVVEGRPVRDGLDHLIQIDEARAELIFFQSPHQKPGESVLPGGVAFANSLTVDVSQTPGTIDLKSKNPAIDGTEISRGIFRFSSAGRLELCIAAPGMERPTVFNAAPGSKREFYICSPETDK